MGMKKFKSLALLLILFSSSFSAYADTLKVLSYNTWGVPLAVWDTWRYQAAMIEIEKLNPDVVVLSEVFTAKAKHAFLSRQYPYHADGGQFLPRLVGSGLRILSKYPLENHATLTYRSCKKADCLSRKGANLVTVIMPSGKKLNVVATHLNAAGGEETRIDQLVQLKIFSEWYEDRHAPTLIAGDLNFQPQSNEYDYTVKNLEVRDGWTDTHPASEPGITYDAYENHYAHDYCIKLRDPLFKGRIDYLFTKGAIKTLATQLEMNEGDDVLSDHYGLMGEFEI